jgi:predicted nuclease of predicted toxin-antitoxin system
LRFLLDHDVPDTVAHLLRHWGHEPIRLRETLPVTASDEEVFAHAQSLLLAIISCNRNHFLTLAQAAVAAQPPRPFAGLIVLVRRRTRQAECAHLLSLLRRAGENGITGNINFA